MPTKGNSRGQLRQKVATLQRNLLKNRDISLFLQRNALLKKRETIIDYRSKIQELRALSGPKTQVAVVQLIKSRADRVRLSDTPIKHFT